MTKCPECGGKIVNGKCADCGYKVGSAPGNGGKKPTPSRKKAPAKKGSGKVPPQFQKKGNNS